MHHIPDPWTPVQAREINSQCDIEVWGRRYRHDHSLLPTSLTTQGQEILYAPMRLTGMAYGEKIEWEDDASCYLMSSSPEKAEVNTYAQCTCLIANTTFSCEYDGGVRWDIKVMPRGKTVPQGYGLEACPIKGWDLTELRLEIPLRKEICSLYVCFPTTSRQHGKPHDYAGTPLADNGRIPDGGMKMCFNPLLWLGNERAGIQFAAESDELWQPADHDAAMEIRDEGDHFLLVMNLLNSRPRQWAEPGINSCPLCFRLGMMVTPVKPFNKALTRLRSVHIDCFTKIESDYWPFLNEPVTESSAETVLDRLCRAGVELLILHEKWNRIQNYWRVPVERAREIHLLVEACHKRGIKVIPYFGYEITTAMPEFGECSMDVINIAKKDDIRSGWYRTPWQRAMRVCYASSWSERFARGVLECLSEFSFDGVYLDTTTDPYACVNRRHGCGYVDANGDLKPTYPIFAIREMLKKIYEGVHARGGIVNPHVGGVTGPIMYSFSDMLWDGEHIQTSIRDHGPSNFSLEYFRAEYLGVNMGIPVQFIVYEFPPVWTFDKSLSLSLIHGIYPRPNSVWHPLDVMEKIWNIIDAFGIECADFHGYWESEAEITADCDAVKVSYYRRTRPDGRPQWLVYAANPGPTRLENVHLSLGDHACYDAMEEKAIDAPEFDFEPYSIRIFTLA